MLSPPVRGGTYAFARGRPRPAAGPERATFLERGIAAVPLPYPVTCVLLAALSQTPGLLLAVWIDTGSVDQALAAAFPGMAADGLAVHLAGASVGVAFYAVLLWMIRYVRLRLVAASETIAPLLPDDEAGFRRIYGIVNAPLPILGLAVALGAFFRTLGPNPTGTGTAHTVFVLVQLSIVALATSTILWTFFVSLWGLRRLGKEPLRLTPYTEDPMLGLRPLGAMSVSATTVYFAMVAVVLVTALFSPQSPLYLAFLLGLLALGAVLFVLPLLGIHRKMLDEKRKAERTLAELAAREWKEMEAAPAGAPVGLAELGGMVVSLRRFVAHERAERKVASLPTWPFDPAVTGRIAAIVLTGVVAVLGRAAVDWFLARP